MGNSLALYNPPTRVAEEFAMIDCISGGRLIAGFPVGTPMDTCYAYGQNPSHAARALSRGARPGEARLDREGHLRLQRPLQPAALRQHLAAPDPERAAPADLDSRAAARSRPGSGAPRWTTSTATSPTTATRPAWRRCRASGTRWSGSARTATRTAPASCSSSASPRAASRRSSSTAEPAEYFYGRCLHVDPRFAMPPGYITEATQRAGIEGKMSQGARNLANPATKAALKADQHEGHRRPRLRHHRLARRGGRADPPGRRPASMSAT